MDTRRQYIMAPRDLAAAHCRAASVIEDGCKYLTSSHPQELGDHGAMYIPAAILRAFSIELALKSLYYAEYARSAPRDSRHDLQTLLGLLTAESQGKIKAAADSMLERPFADVLADIRTVFVDWRYIYEKFENGASLDIDTDEVKAVAHAVFQVLDAKIKATP